MPTSAIYEAKSIAFGGQSSEGGGLPEEGEDIEVFETTLEQAAAMIAAGEIIDAKTVILVQFLRERTGG